VECVCRRMRERMINCWGGRRRIGGGGDKPESACLLSSYVWLIDWSINLANQSVDRSVDVPPAKKRDINININRRRQKNEKMKKKRTDDERQQIYTTITVRRRIIFLADYTILHKHILQCKKNTYTLLFA
jgi:hypothetical protein